MRDTDRLLQVAAIEAGVMPQLVVHPLENGWAVRQKHANVTVRFPSRAEAADFAKRWATDNPPCLLRFADAAP